MSTISPQTVEESTGPLGRSCHSYARQAHIQATSFSGTHCRKKLVWKREETLQKVFKKLQTIKASLRLLNIDTTTWKMMAQKCPTGIASSIRTIKHMKQGTQLKHSTSSSHVKTRATGATTAVPSRVCPTCVRTFCAQIDPISHLWTYHI